MRFLYCFVAFFCWQLATAQVDASLQNLLDQPSLKHAQIGISIIDAQSGAPIVAYQVDKKMIPASVLKTITTASSYLLNGPEHEFLTEVSYTGAVLNGALQGDVLIEGYGDPTLCANSTQTKLFFESILEALQANGIHKIEGEIKVLPEVPTTQTNQTWLYEDVANYYGANAYPINFNRNSYTISLTQNNNLGAPVSVHSVVPFVPYEFDCQVTSAAANSGDQAYILGVPFANERQITGTIPTGDGLFTIKGSIANPNETLKQAFTQYLSAQGVDIENKEVQAFNKTLLMSYASEALAEIIQFTNAQSNNLYAEALLNLLGEGDNQLGLEVVKQLIAQFGLHPNEITMVDGSGMSLKNAVTPSFMAHWLYEVYQMDESFIDMLPVAGESGTMRYFNSSRMKGMFAAKSGSMDGVLNYVGYVTTADGSKLCVALMVNHYNGDMQEVRRALVKYLEHYL